MSGAINGDLFVCEYQAVVVKDNHDEGIEEDKVKKLSDKLKVWLKIVTKMEGTKVKSGKLGFSENFVLSGSAAAVAKTSAAPIERVKLLLQNQGELLKQGRLDRRYGGVRECVVRTLNNEGVTSFWRGNFASVVRYFPQQALNFAFKVGREDILSTLPLITLVITQDEIQKQFKVSKNASKNL